MSLWEYANPKKFLATTETVHPGAVAGQLRGVCLAVGLIWGFFFTPDDYRQGSTVKIIYPACAVGPDGDQLPGS